MPRIKRRRRIIPVPRLPLRPRKTATAPTPIDQGLMAMDIPDSTKTSNISNDIATLPSLSNIDHSLCGLCFNIQIHDLPLDKGHISCFCDKESVCCAKGYQGWLQHQTDVTLDVYQHIPKETILDKLVRKNCSTCQTKRNADENMEDTKLMDDCLGMLAAFKLDHQPSHRECGSLADHIF